MTKLINKGTNAGGSNTNKMVYHMKNYRYF